MEAEMYANRRFRRSSGRALVGSVLKPLVTISLLTSAAAQSPVTYSYTTGDQPYGSELADLFLGNPVSGTFVYDSGVPATGMVTNPTNYGATIYAAAVTDLSGSVAGNSFSDPVGRMVVGDDTYGTTREQVDILVLAGDPNQPSGGLSEPFDFSGFQIAGHTLKNARLFWIEGVLGAGDFQADQELPAGLPDFYGRLALDFVAIGTTEPVLYVFFDLLTVTVVDEGVAMDVRPGSATNSLNPMARGNLPVAILTTDTFDALQVDPLSVTFGPLAASECHGRGHVMDVDGDGDMDLLFHFWIPDTGIQCGDVSATLSGETFDGQAFTASDSISTVGCHDRG